MMARTSTSGQGRKPGVPNKITRPIRELAGNFSEGAIKVLVQILIDQNAPTPSRVAAAKEILDRAHGRPAASATLKVGKHDTLADMGAKVIAAATEGTLPIEHANTLMNALAEQAKLKETGELLERLESLELMIQKANQ